MKYFFQTKSNWLWLLFSILAILLCLRNYLLPPDAFDSHYTHYNNFIIFKQSFIHLWEGKNLYAAYPQEYFDLFKYTPTFALVFGAISWLPDWLGLAVWNLLNVFVLVFAIKSLPVLKDTQKLFFGILVIQETITSTMNSQSNVLIAGLLVLAWAQLEKGSFIKATLFIAGTAFIKIFGILFFTLFLFYPKWHKAVLPGFAVLIVLFAIPLPITGFQGLKTQYSSYLVLLANDQDTFIKYSVMGWLKSWFGIVPPKNTVVFLGLALQLLPAILLGFWQSKLENAFQYRTKITALFSASLLIWLVIFNHMAESATYVIAVTGVLLWFFYSGLSKSLRLVLLIPVIVFTCFGPSDIFPRELRQQIVADWQLKVFPCILVWGVCLLELTNNIFSLAKKPNAPSE